MRENPAGYLGINIGLATADPSSKASATKIKPALADAFARDAEAEERLGGCNVIGRSRCAFLCTIRN